MKTITTDGVGFYVEADDVYYPSHYELEGLGIEAIDVIRSVLGSEKFAGYCRGNALKYLIRADHKNGVEDLEKARVYLNWEIETALDELFTDHIGEEATEDARNENEGDNSGADKVA